MTGITVKDLMAEQEKRLAIQKEEESRHDRKFETAKIQFERKPYYMAYGKGGAQ
jgi:hypothetical protein